MSELLKEFREFAFKGNMIDLAVGMIIGAAFTGLVNSIVGNMVMPIISLFTGGIDFNNMYVPLNDAARAAAQSGADIETARAAGAVFAYGTFLTDLIQFLILAFVVFLMVRALAKMMKNAKEEEAAEAPATKECQFCKTEIHIDAVKCPNCTADLK